MVKVPPLFKQPHPFKYPLDNHIIFEEWISETIKEDIGTREYLPIFWTGYLVRASFGEDKNKLKLLQDYVNSLDKSKKYWSVIQYDPGPVIDLSGIDIKMYAASGSKIDYPVPLVCVPHKYPRPQGPRNIFANFIGAMTHDLRRRMMLSTKEAVNCYITEKGHPLNTYCNILGRSVFTLCPRGFGQSSFRIAEALQYGSIPVYISDEFIIPHNMDFNKYGVIIDEKDVDKTMDILLSIPKEQIEAKQLILADTYEKHFTYHGCWTTMQQDLIKS